MEPSMVTARRGHSVLAVALLSLCGIGQGFALGQHAAPDRSFAEEATAPAIGPRAATQSTVSATYGGPQIQLTPVAPPAGAINVGYSAADINGQTLTLTRGGVRTYWNVYMSNWAYSMSGYYGSIHSATMSGATADCGGGPGSCPGAGDLVPADQPCVSSIECLHAFAGPAQCNGYSRCEPVYVNQSRPDWVHSNAAGQAVVSDEMYYGGQSFFFSTQVPNALARIAQAGVQYYGATVIIDVPVDARGTYTIRLYEDRYTVPPDGHMLGFGRIDGQIILPTEPPLTDCNQNGAADAEDIASQGSQDADADGIPDECEVLYVNAVAAPGGDCTSWASACKLLQEAILKAEFPGSVASEIWVAAGTYKPDYGSGDRTASFYLASGIATYGGFAGFETSRAARAGLFEETILSGDLAGDDGPDFTNRGDNSHHVVAAWSNLDGFTISGGNADGAGSTDGGGGGIRAGSATFANLLITGNMAAEYGGGMTTSGTALLENCRFVGNRSGGKGGAFASFIYGSPIVRNCAFVSNDTEPAGYSGCGGAVWSNGGTTVISDTVFLGNSSRSGGAICKVYISYMDIVNCLFSGNTVSYMGGALYNDAGNFSLVNSAFSGNVAALGGAISYGGSDQPQVTNCILWGNGRANATSPIATDEIHTSSSSPGLTVTHSTVRPHSGGSIPPGPGNMAENPLFADADGADNVAGTEDDDLRLSTGSRSVDAGDSAAIDLPGDLLGNIRIVDGDGQEESPGVSATVDMGPYEYGSTGVPSLDCGRPDDPPCPAGTFCKYLVGICGAAPDGGICSPVPDQCPGTWALVCGCDDRPYQNDCYADRAGVSIAHGGYCKQCGGWDWPDVVCDTGQFCKYNNGGCGRLEQSGACWPIPQSCPPGGEPVCGCDGVTYANECESILANVSIADSNECTLCSASEGAGCPQDMFCKLPAGSCNDPQAQGLCAWWLPACEQTTNLVCGCDGVTYPNECHADLALVAVDHPGDCHEPAPAERAASACPACAVPSCAACSSGSCEDGQVSLCETIAYACAWQNGCNDDLAGMTRSAYLWRSGECYCWEAADENWVPGECREPGTALQCAPQSSGVASAASSPLAGEAWLLIERASHASDLSLMFEVLPDAGVSAVAADLSVPKGWEVVSIGDGGRYDSLNRKLKFGPFFDDHTRSLTATVRPIGRQGSRQADSGLAKDRLTSASPPLNLWSGTASFDGMNQPLFLKK